MMIKNNKGMTLIELLGALTLSVILFSLIFSIFQMGSKSYKSDLEANAFQTDADIVISNISSTFYKKKGQSFPITLHNGLVFLDGKSEPVSSPALSYAGSSFTWEGGLLTVHLVINSKKTLKIKPFEMKTTLNYPWKEPDQ